MDRGQSRVIWPDIEPEELVLDRLVVVGITDFYFFVSEMLNMNANSVNLLKIQLVDVKKKHCDR